MKMYLVGGMVRDRLLGRKSKDADFAVEAESYEQMRATLEAEGFKIFQERPEFGTIRAQFPPGDERIEQFATRDADFVLCRIDGAYSNGRRPDSVEPGTLHDDLARRDFTINAMAMDEFGSIIDPFNGQVDLRFKVLRCVGDPEVRMNEDFLRALRAVRFAVTLDFQIGAELMRVLRSDSVIRGVAKVTHERRREELTKAFGHDTISTIRQLEDVSPKFMKAALTDLKLEPTSKTRI